MKTLVIAAIAALTLTLVASAGPRDGSGCPEWGCGSNGTSLNGIWENGIWSNGSQYQGSQMQGVNMQGVRSHGAEVVIGSAVLVRVELPR